MNPAHRPDTLFQDQVARSVCHALLETGAVAGAEVDLYLGPYGGWQHALGEPTAERPAGFGLALADTINLIVDLLSEPPGDASSRTVDPAADKLASLGFDGRRNAERHRVSPRITPMRLLMLLARRRLGDATVDRLIAEASHRHLTDDH